MLKRIQIASFLLFCAFALLLLVSLSLPYLTAIDFVRVNFHGDNTTSEASISGTSIRQLRFGTWAYCAYETDGNRQCPSATIAYTTTVAIADNKGNPVTVGASWTRGLVIHPVAAIVTLLAFLLSLLLLWLHRGSSPRGMRLVKIVTCCVSFFAAVITLITFVVDIALFARVKGQMGSLPGADSDTKPAAAFYMDLVSFVVLLCATWFVYLARHKSRADGSQKYSESQVWRNKFNPFNKTGDY